MDPLVDGVGGSRGIDELENIFLEFDEGEDHLDFGLNCLDFIDVLEGVKVVDEEFDGGCLLLELAGELVGELLVEILLQQLLY